MISEILGFTLSRTIPEKCLVGVMTGAYKLCGGVIRDNSGQIVAHLINASSVFSIASPPLATAFGIVDAAFGAINTYQLQKVGPDVKGLTESVAGLQAATSGILSLTKGTMLLSGLTLAVSAAILGSQPHL